MKNKILIIVIFVLAFLFIGLGLFFTFTGDKNTGGLLGGDSNDGEIVDVEEELLENEEVHSENVFIFRTVDDAVTYLISSYETTDVKVTYNDGVKAIIKVFADTDKEIKYNYFITGGDLIMDY